MSNTSTLAGYRNAWIAQVAIIIASIACGTAFWLVVQLTTYEETTLLIPIEPTGLPDEVILDASWEPKDTLVKFTVPRAIRDDIKPEKFRLIVDFASVRSSFGTQLSIPGSTQLTLSDVQTDIEGVTPVEILSRQISWTALLRHAKARVVPQFIGEPAPGFETKGFTIVQGETSKGDEMTVIMTAEAERAFITSGQELLVVKTSPIDLNGRRQPFLERKNLIFPHQGMSPFPERNGLVTVEIDIVEKTSTRIIQSVPIQTSTLRNDVRVFIEPAVVQLSVVGRTSLLDQLSPDKVRAEVWGIPEVPTEAREFAVDSRILDPAIRSGVVSVEAVPRSVMVRVVTLEQEPPPVTEEDRIPLPSQSMIEGISSQAIDEDTSPGLRQPLTIAP